MSLLKKCTIIILIMIGVAVITIAVICFPLLAKLLLFVLAIFCCLYLVMRFSGDFTKDNEETQVTTLSESPKMISPKDYKQKRIRGSDIIVVQKQERK